MTSKQHAALITLINETTPKVRGDLSDAAWEQILIDQNEEMTRRLFANDPLDVRRGLGRGVVVFSLFEVMLSALRESGVDTQMIVGEKEEVVLTVPSAQIPLTAITATPHSDEDADADEDEPEDDESDIPGAAGDLDDAGGQEASEDTDDLDGDDDEASGWGDLSDAPKSELVSVGDDA